MSNSSDTDTRYTDGLGEQAYPDDEIGVDADDELRMLPVESIAPNPRQPRSEFNEASLDQLGRTIEDIGLVQPISVRPRPDIYDDDFEYELIAGERRLRASKRRDLDEIKAIVTDADLNEQQRNALIENIHRDDLTAAEKGDQIIKIFTDAGIEVDDSDSESLQKLATDVKAVYNHTTENESEPGVRIDFNTRKRSGDEAQRLATLNEEMERAGTNGGAVQRWIKNVDVDEAIQEAQVKALNSDDQTPADSHTVARLSGNDDRELQMQTYEKIRADGMSKRRGGKFTTAIDRATDEIRADVLTEDAEVGVEKLHKITSIDDEETQNKAFETVRSQDMGSKTAKTFVGKLKSDDVGETLRSHVLEADTTVDTGLIKAVEGLTDLDRQERAYQKLQEMDYDGDDAERFVATLNDRAAQDDDAEVDRLLQEGVFINPDSLDEPVTVDISDDAAQRLRDRFEAGGEWIGDIMDDPDSQKRGEISRNWSGHHHAHPHVDHIACPICGNDSSSLVWECHGFTFEESVLLVSEKYQQSVYQDDIAEDGITFDIGRALDRAQSAGTENDVESDSTDTPQGGEDE